MKKLLGLPYPKDAKMLEAAKAYANSAEAMHKTELLIGFLAGAKWAEEQIKGIWHDVKEIPKSFPIICQDEIGNEWVQSSIQNYEWGDWSAFVETEMLTRWAYIDDFKLKKGGEI